MFWKQIKLWKLLRLFLFPWYFSYTFAPMNEELNHILEKVTALYLKYGIKSVTMDDVSRELGISKKTLYQYVSNKNELVKKVVERQLEERNCDMQNLMDQNLNAIEELLEVNIHIIKMMKQNNPSVEYDLKKYYPDLQQKVTEIRRDRMYRSVYNNIEKGKKEGLYLKEIDTDIIARLQISRFENILDDTIFPMEDFTRPRVIYEIFMYHIRGIANEKGIEMLKKKLKEKDIEEYLQTE